MFGFSVVCWNARTVYEVARILKRVRPGAFIVVGGPEVGPIAEQVLAEQPAIDAVVRGEGEVTLPDLLHSLVRGGDPASVPGVTSRVTAPIASWPARARIEDLDSLPIALRGGRARDGRLGVPRDLPGLSPQLRLLLRGQGRHAHPVVLMGADRVRHRGARLHAGHALVQLHRPGLQPDRRASGAPLGSARAVGGARNPASHHRGRHRASRRRAGRTCSLAPAWRAWRPGRSPWGKAALKTCGRSFDAERFRAGVEACRSHGISVECDLIVGLPGDTVQDVVDGIEFAIGC